MNTADKLMFGYGSELPYVQKTIVEPSQLTMFKKR